MTDYVVIPEQSGLLRLPTGITVGDEFRVVGRVRVTAISEGITESPTQTPRFRPSGERRVRAYIVEIEASEDT